MNFKGGDLEEKYKDLNAELESSEEQANEVRERVAAVEDVAGAKTASTVRPAIAGGICGLTVRAVLHLLLY